LISVAEKKAIDKETKYKQLKRVRRFFIINEQKTNLNDERVLNILKGI
jgi:hypothetical protein